MSTSMDEARTMAREMGDERYPEPEDEQIETNRRLHPRMGCSMCGRDRTECLCDPSLCSQRSDGL